VSVAGAAALAAAALALASPTGARATAAPPPHQCAPANRWCNGVFLQHGRRVFKLAGFDLHGRYRLCVTPPEARERCHAFGLAPNGAGANASTVSFAGHFPHARPGRYRVRWIYGGDPLGHTLAFTA
jgi:hypothetical protein